VDLEEDETHEVEVLEVDLEEDETHEVEVLEVDLEPQLCTKLNVMDVVTLQKFHSDQQEISLSIVLTVLEPEKKEGTEELHHEEETDEILEIVETHEEEIDEMIEKNDLRQEEI